MACAHKLLTSYSCWLSSWCSWSEVFRQTSRKSSRQALSRGCCWRLLDNVAVASFQDVTEWGFVVLPEHLRVEGAWQLSQKKHKIEPHTLLLQPAKILALLRHIHRITSPVRFEEHWTRVTLKVTYYFGDVSSDITKQECMTQGDGVSGYSAWSFKSSVRKCGSAVASSSAPTQGIVSSLPIEASDLIMR